MIADARVHTYFSPTPIANHSPHNLEAAACWRYVAWLVAGWPLRNFVIIVGIPKLASVAKTLLELEFHGFFKNPLYCEPLCPP